MDFLIFFNKKKSNSGIFKVFANPKYALDNFSVDGAIMAFPRVGNTEEEKSQIHVVKQT